MPLMCVTGEKPYKCGQCNRFFVSMGVLKAHAKTHTGMKDFRCHICQATFTTNGSLTRHMMIHSSVRPFKCPYCIELFATAVRCKRHMKVHREGRGTSRLLHVMRNRAKKDAGRWRHLTHRFIIVILKQGRLLLDSNLDTLFCFLSDLYNSKQ